MAQERRAAGQRGSDAASFGEQCWQRPTVAVGEQLMTAANARAVLWEREALPWLQCARGMVAGDGDRVDVCGTSREGEKPARVGEYPPDEDTGEQSVA